VHDIAQLLFGKVEGMAVLVFTGERFLPGGEYSLDDLTETVRDLAHKGNWWLFASVHHRMNDLGMTFLELDRCLKNGNVVAFEVAPSRVEMRLEVRHDHGDVADYRPVVWLDRDGKLCCADIRDGSEGTRS
jgi:hypothetical protein